MEIEIVEFRNLYQFVKMRERPYLQSYRINELQAVYYEIYSNGGRDTFAYCIDVFRPEEYLKFSDGELVGIDCGCEGANSIALVHIKNDTLLQKILAIPKRLKEEQAKKKAAAKRKAQSKAHTHKKKKSGVKKRKSA